MIKVGKAAALAAATSLLFAIGGGAAAQGPGPGGPRPPSNQALPKVPTAVALPTLSAEVKGPGPMFDSAPSQARGLDVAHFDYATREYFASGTADGKPYTTRVVVRMPRDASKFSGLVLAESMHSSGAAHMFEFTSGYLMSAGHAAVEILTTSPAQFTALNAKRYEKLAIADGQQNEIIAQVASLIRAKSPLTGGAPVRKLVMSGTSMSAGTLINYLPAHLVYRTPDMQRIFDGFMPTSNGSTIMEIDVPLIQLPTMHEVENNVPRRQDSDEPGKQYRLFEFAGVGHVDSRDNARLIPNPCVKPLSTVPLQAYYSVGLYHLLRWVDRGIAPPHAARVLLDRDTTNDDSMMALDAHGNPQGGVRTPYVDVPVAKYRPVNTAVEPVIANPSAYVKANGLQGAQTMCRLSAWQEPMSAAQLKELYGSKRDYVRKFEARLGELEQQGWSLPVYHDLILADAKAVDF
ncbi:MAG TPA: alpha/beta hydrolase domain-containing protein [Gammaproteobacteria bacterium]|nr:alpha/beta hydrolase domain-containing protein [Gammaproteobacteria bacterium]